MNLKLKLLFIFFIFGLISARFLPVFAQTSSVRVLTGACTNAEIILQWYSFPNAQSYKITATDSSDSSPPKETTITTTYYSYAGTPGHNYSFEITALDSTGKEISSPSKTPVQCPVANQTTFLPAQNLHATKCHDYTFKVEFTLNPQATGYVIKSIGANTGSNLEHTINFFDQTNTKTFSYLSYINGNKTYDWSMAVKYPEGQSEFVNGPRFGCWDNTPIEVVNNSNQNVNQRFMITKSVSNLIGITIFPNQPITVGEFLSKTNGSCIQIRSLANASEINTASTVLNSSTPLIPARGYGVICDDVFEPGSEVVSQYYNGKGISIDDIKLILTPGWQYISSPIILENQQYTAEEFLTDLSNGSGFNCSQIQYNQIRFTSEIAERSWFPSTPYIKGGSQNNFPISQGQGYKVFCSVTGNSPRLPTPLPTATSTPIPSPTLMTRRIPSDLQKADIDSDDCLGRNDLKMVINAVIAKIGNPNTNVDSKTDIDQNRKWDIRDYNIVARAIQNNPNLRCTQ